MQKLLEKGIVLAFVAAYRNHLHFGGSAVYNLQQSLPHSSAASQVYSLSVFGFEELPVQQFQGLAFIVPGKGASAAVPLFNGPGAAGNVAFVHPPLQLPAVVGVNCPVGYKADLRQGVLFLRCDSHPFAFFSGFLSADYAAALAAVQGIEYFDVDSCLPCRLHSGSVEHFGPVACQGKGRFVTQSAYGSGLLHVLRVAGHYAGHIGPDLEPVRLQCCGVDGCAVVRSAPSQSADPAIAFRGYEAWCHKYFGFGMVVYGLADSFVSQLIIHPVFIAADEIT